MTLNRHRFSWGRRCSNRFRIALLSYELWPSTMGISSLMSLWAGWFDEHVPCIHRDLHLMSVVSLNQVAFLYGCVNSWFCLGVMRLLWPEIGLSFNSFLLFFLLLPFLHHFLPLSFVYFLPLDFLDFLPLGFSSLWSSCSSYVDTCEYVCWISLFAGLFCLCQSYLYLELGSCLLCYDPQ